MHNSKNNERKYITYIVALFVLALALGVHSVARGDTIADLYEARVPVSTQDKKERNKSLQQAFIEVLVRISGRIDIVQSSDYPKIQEAVELATRYAQQYRYLKHTPASGADQDNNLILWVRFDETAVNSLLGNNEIAVWGKTRPATLVWLVIDNGAERELVGNDSEHVARVTLNEQAKRRGVPLRFPLLDLKDHTALRASDVWGNFESTILKASQRYQPAAVLVGRVSQASGGHWSARWSLYADSRRKDYNFTGADIKEVLRPGVSATAEGLAARYASVGQSDNRAILLKVKEINSFSDYNRVIKYLSKLSGVRSVHPYQLVANTAIFRLRTPSGRLDVARAITLGHTLVTEPVEMVAIADLPGANPGAGDIKRNKIVPDLSFRLVP